MNKIVVGSVVQTKMSAPGHVPWGTFEVSEIREYRSPSGRLTKKLKFSNQPYWGPIPSRHFTLVDPYDDGLDNWE